MLKIRFASGPRSLQYKAERLGWSSSLLLQTGAALIGDYGREHTDYRYVLYMTSLQKTQTIPLTMSCIFIPKTITTRIVICPAHTTVNCKQSESLNSVICTEIEDVTFEMRCLNGLKVGWESWDSQFESWNFFKMMQNKDHLDFIIWCFPSVAQLFSLDTCTS